MSDEENDGEDRNTKNEMIKPIDYKNMDKSQLIELLTKIIAIEHNYTDDKSCEADAAIEEIRKIIYPGYESRYD